ncbi:MAG TPA: 2'-5' RNA ligase family protein [Candidatus Saccharimonadales bacterium]|nr:2'-5' RNA ligase family protein [Candidatus Saccharimonadales bacterium]
MFSQKYAIIAPLEALEVGTEFPSSGWPLHITLADTFAIKRQETDFDSKLQTLLANQKVVTVTVGDDEFFGPEKQTRVALLIPNEELRALHYTIVHLLKQEGATFNNPEYNEGGFRPHSTVQAHARLNKDERVTISSLCLIDMFPNDDPYQRRVLTKVNLHQ